MNAGTALVPLPRTFQAGDPEWMERLTAKVAERLPGYVVVEVDEDAGYAVVAQVGRSAKVEAVRFAAGAKPEAVAHHIERAYPGHTMIGFDPHSTIARHTRLDPVTAAVRRAVVRATGWSPWTFTALPQIVDGELVAVTITDVPDAQPVTAMTVRLEAAATQAIGDSRWRVLVDAAQNVARLERFDDPLVGVVEYDDTLVGKPTVRRVPFAVTESGDVFAPPILETNFLLGGVPGSGKSGSLTALLGSLAQIRNVALILLDPKRVEFSSWRPRASTVATTPEQIEDVLAACVAEMERRYQMLEQSGKKKVSVEMLTQFPLLVIVVDELAELTASGVTKEEKQGDGRRAQMLRRLVAKGRAAGVATILATQRPSADLVPTSLRDLIQLRVSHATTNPIMTDIILGTGMAEFAPADRIAISQRGVGYALAETDRRPTRIRSMWLDDDLVGAHVERFAHLKVGLLWLGSDGIGKPDLSLLDNL